MGKENDSDNSKKRGKTVNNTTMPAGKDSDMYMTINDYEEKEAMERQSEKDSESFLATCDDIRKAMAKIANLKASSNADAKEEIKELQIQTSLSFIELKKLNRMEKFRTKFARDSLINAKSSVDSRHLQLQNLLYEVMHLKKEVIKCLQFKSKDELIELVSEEELYKQAPESISRPEITKTNPHQLRLARLEWELTQRKQLAALCDELTESKKAVASSIETKQTRLDNLAPQLKTILEASKPLQESLGLPLDKVRQEHQKAALLSSPLYVLYAKTSAYRDAYDTTLIVEVEGDEDEAKRVSNQDGLQESDSDAETQVENVVEDPPVHKKRHHRLSKEARQEEKKSKLLQRHPLNVKIIITLKNETRMILQFYYMIQLKIVTVESRLETENSGGICAGDILVSESVLHELYPQDSGLESPKSANHYQLQRYNLGSFSSLGLGIPYKWAQRMAGLHFVAPTVQEQNSSSKESGQDSVESVIKEIKRRMIARLELYNEIRMLESGNMLVFTDTVDPVPEKVSSVIYRFSTMTWKSYSSYPETAFYREELVSPLDMLYEAVLRRGNNELIAHIAIKPDYPKITPVFSIRINPTPTSTGTVRDIEREVNVMWIKPPSLSAQIQRLRACFDIYLETEGLTPKEKIYFHAVKGRTRSRPYKYLPIGGGIFTHR